MDDLCQVCPYCLGWDFLAWPAEIHTILWLFPGGEMDWWAVWEGQEGHRAASVVKTRETGPLGSIDSLKVGNDE